ncbi:uncharacterized protein LOC142559879 [Dermacentor variabilis]|uniref:uncharacterized protein LOC142559879 n=1 Tax=Dermacentor variabilis TaxID=34621 RepID=UPI003F5B3AF5
MRHPRAKHQCNTVTYCSSRLAKRQHLSKESRPVHVRGRVGRRVLVGEPPLSAPERLDQVLDSLPVLQHRIWRHIVQRGQVDCGVQGIFSGQHCGLKSGRVRTCPILGIAHTNEVRERRHGKRYSLTIERVHSKKKAGSPDCELLGVPPSNTTSEFPGDLLAESGDDGEDVPIADFGRDSLE